MSRKLTDSMLKTLNKIGDRYVKHGVRMSNLIEIAEDAPEDISDEAVIIGIRLALSHEYRVHEYFTVHDVMAVTGETEDEVMKRIKELGVTTYSFSSTIPGLFSK